MVHAQQQKGLSYYQLYNFHSIWELHNDLDFNILLDNQIFAAKSLHKKAFE